MHSRNRFVLLFAVGLISLLAVSTLLAQDNGRGNGNGNGNGNTVVQAQPTQGSDNGNHQGGGNNGNGQGNNGSNAQNNGNQNNAAQTPVEQQSAEPVIVQEQPPATIIEQAPVIVIEQAPTTTVVEPSVEILGCQKNNPNRLDCSSLEVSGVCDGSIAVFTIRNTGEAGNGDMRAPTQYRLVVDGIVVETGSIQLAGGATTQITYSGGGSVTLEADQQVGHPGNSHPRSSLNCGEASSTPTAEPTQEITPTIEPTATEEVTPTIEAPMLSAEVICKEDGSILFIVSNNGGDMLESAYYTVSDSYSSTIDSGYVQLAASEQTSFQYWFNGELTLTIGDLIVVSSPSCVPSTEEPTPAVTPTVEPTVSAPDLTGQSYCQMDGSILFAIYNQGGDMPTAEFFTVTDSYGSLISDGYAQIFSGQPFTLYFSGYTSLTFTMGSLVLISPECVTITPEPTAEVTPPADDSVLVGSASCQSDGSILFVISNLGDSMPTSEYYIVMDSNGWLVGDGWLQLMAGESTSLQYWGYPTLTFTMGNLVIMQDAECIPPTPEPTPEITPTPEPTQEVTPTPEPTQTSTPSGTLGCQKNNPDRTDCSSLQVTATCQDGVAVFTVRNTGTRGEGDMLTATEYRIIVDGVVVESGSVQLLGNTSIQITYTGNGSITLEADQQTGHPGKSQPQATVNCSA